MKKRYLFAEITLALVFCLFIAGCAKTENIGNMVPVNFANVEFDTPSTPQGFANGDITAEELVSGIKIGWNLGNTLDATGLTWLGSNPSVSRMETAWGNPVTTKANITAIKNAGFNAVRIPVSWNKAADSNYNIRADWIARVVEIVNYAVDNDMYIILNTHHDENIFKFMNSDMEESKKAFKKIWEQISYVFRNYDEKLIFEGLNEPRTIGSSLEWNGGTLDEHKNLNEMHQLFTDTVRASGGNNVRRVLMVSTYAASAEQRAMSALVIPQDPSNTVNKFIVSIHSYSPYNFALNERSPVNTWSKDASGDTSPITDWLNRAHTTFVSKGLPVIGGEFGALDKNNEEARAEWAEFYVSYAKSKGIKCIWWDNGGDFKLFDRNTGEFYYPLIYEALMRGVE